jgi:hypothetical protein
MWVMRPGWRRHEELEGSESGNGRTANPRDTVTFERAGHYGAWVPLLGHEVDLPG